MSIQEQSELFKPDKDACYQYVYDFISDELKQRQNMQHKHPDRYAYWQSRINNAVKVRTYLKELKDGQ